MKLADITYGRIRTLSVLASVVYGPCAVAITIYKYFAGRTTISISVLRYKAWTDSDPAFTSATFDYDLYAWQRIVSAFCKDIMLSFFESIERNLNAMEID